MPVTIDDLCNLNLNQVTELSDDCLDDNPACPRDALMRSPGVVSPNDEEFTNLANGNYVAADYAGFDFGDNFWGTAKPGNGCSTDCAELEKFDKRAFQIRWNDCISEDAMVNFCRGTSPVADPFMTMVNMVNQKRTVENTSYILAGLGGIYATASADAASNIVCDFTTESYDGTPNLSIDNLAHAIPDLACRPDFWLADHFTVQRLSGQGFTPYCCGDDGQVFNTVAPLQDPNGIPIIEMPSEYYNYFDPADDGTNLMIGVKNGAINWERTTENDTSERQRGFVQNAFNVKTNPCDPTTLFMNERAALCFQGFTYTGPIVKCSDQITKPLLMTAGTNAYAHSPDSRRGWDKSGFVFLKGNIPSLRAAI